MRVRAAVDASRESAASVDDAILIMARTDALKTHGLEEAPRARAKRCSATRARTFAGQAPRTVDEMKPILAEVALLVPTGQRAAAADRAHVAVRARRAPARSASSPRLVPARPAQARPITPTAGAGRLKSGGQPPSEFSLPARSVVLDAGLRRRVLRRGGAVQGGRVARGHRGHAPACVFRCARAAPQDGDRDVIRACRLATGK